MNKIKFVIIICVLFFPFIVNARNLEIGDYIELVPDAESYTILKEDTGYSENQVLTPKELTLWRVIRKNEDGTIDAVSEYVSSNGVLFFGDVGYIYYISTMQKIANSYSKEGYTERVRIIGYDGQTPVISDTSPIYGNYNTRPSSSRVPYITTGVGEEYINGLAGDTLYLRDYQLVGALYKNDPSNYGETGLKAFSEDDISQSKQYLLASRDYDAWGDGSYGFALHSITAEGYLYNVDWFLRDYSRYGGWTNESQGGYIRPIVTLKSKVYIDEGEGNKSQPYTLTLQTKSNIYVENDDGKGNIEFSNNESITSGTNVVFKIFAKKGFIVENIEIVDSNNVKIDYNKRNVENEYEFIMPSSDVTIIPIYKKIESLSISDLLENPNTGDEAFIIIFLIIISLGTGIIIYRKRNKEY